MARGAPLPEGTLTFLRSDVEGSMDLLRALGPRYDELNEQHARIMRGAIERHGGDVVRTEGDGFFAVFTDPMAGARAAVEAQRAMLEDPWPDGQAPTVRIGLHTGVAHRAGDDYGGLEVGRAARIAALGWGGQIVMSDATRALVMAVAEDGWSARDLGRVPLKGIGEPERIFQLEAPGLRVAFPPLRSAGPDGHGLPVRVSALIGREHELARLVDLLGETRLLTLTGPGGTGKTTLALELARRALPDHKDGVAFIDLQTVSDPASVRAELAHGVGLHDGPAGSAAERLHAFVADRALLIVVDNFEQVMDAAGEVAALVAASPVSRVIVTSRVPLRLSAEQEFPVRPMDLASSDDAHASEAVRLFIDRAQRQRPDLDLDADVEVVHDICRLVDGLPLAIELCAARVSALPIRAIRDRLARRLPLPGSGPRDLPERQRTLQATVAWSYDLLEPQLRGLFARCAVFEASFDLEQAEEICGPGDELGVDILDGLVELVERSLLRRVEDPVGGIRFAMLETIRAFAERELEASGARDEQRRRHADVYAALAALHQPSLLSSGRARAIDRLELDEANLRAAMAWAIEHDDAALALLLANDLWRFWLATGRLGEAARLTSAAMGLSQAQAPSAARIRGLEALGSLHYWSGDMPGASACYEEQLLLARQLGDERGEADACFNLAFTRQVLGDVEGGEEAAMRAESLYARLGDEAAVARVAWARSLALLRPSHPGEAGSEAGLGGGVDAAAVRVRVESVIEQLERLGDDWSLSSARSLEGQVLFMDGRLVDAARSMLSAFRYGLAMREHADIVVALQLTVVLLLHVGEAESGAVVMGATRGASERFGITPPDYSVITGVKDPDAAYVEVLGRAVYEAALERGRRLSLDEALDVLEGIIDRLPIEAA